MLTASSFMKEMLYEVRCLKSNVRGSYLHLSFKFVCGVQLRRECHPDLTVVGVKSATLVQKRAERSTSKKKDLQRVSLIDATFDFDRSGYHGGGLSSSTSPFPAWIEWRSKSIQAVERLRHLDLISSRRLCWWGTGHNFYGGIHFTLCGADCCFRGRCRPFL